MKFEFYTSVSGTAFWNGLVRDLKVRGQEVEIISVMQEEAYRRPRNIFSKLLMRWKLYAGMSLHTRRHISCSIKQPTCRIATTNPFFSTGTCQRKNIAEECRCTHSQPRLRPLS